MSTFPNNVPPAVCVAGHGRSGSSLITRMLLNAGIMVGNRLLGPTASNARGHFEDLDFYELHIEALKLLKEPSSGFTTTPGLTLPLELQDRARKLVQSRRERGKPWGWKDPRSTLFLQDWADLIPESRFLFLIREPWHILDSLYRRGDSLYQADPARAVAVLEHYNTCVLDFVRKFPHRSVIIESTAAARNPERFAEILAERFQLEVQFQSESFEPELLKTDDFPEGRHLVERFFPRVVEQYREMQAHAAMALLGTSVSAEPAAVLRWWVDARQLQQRHEREQRWQTSLLLLDTGKGYTVDDSYPIAMDYQGEFVLDATIPEPRITRVVRWDPVENRTCRVTVTEWILEDETGTQHRIAENQMITNGLPLGSGTYQFAQLDPWLATRCELTVRRVIIRGTMQIDSLEQTLGTVREQLERMTAYPQESHQDAKPLVRTDHIWDWIKHQSIAAKVFLTQVLPRGATS